MSAAKRFLKKVAKTRLLLSQGASRVILGSMVGGAPETFISSLDEASYRPAISRHILERSRIFEPCIVGYPFPENFPPAFRRHKVFEERLIFLLRDVSISPHSGLVWLPEGYILQESVGSLYRLLGWDKQALAGTFLPARALDEAEAILAFPPKAYYHWLLEILPTFLHGLARYPEAKILVPTKAHKHFEEILAIALGAYKDRIIVADGPVRAARVIMVQADAFSGFVHPGDAAKVRGLFPASSRTGRKIYLSRSRAPRRRLGNEKLLEEALNAHEFEIVFAEKLTLAEKAEFVSSADVIIGPHGANLANLAWARPGASILEIFPSDFFGDCFARLSLSLGLDYDYLVSLPDTNSSGEIPIDKVLEKVVSWLHPARRVS